jgi:hypothetical protein
MRFAMDNRWNEIKETLITLAPVIVLTIAGIIMWILKKIYIG